MPQTTRAACWLRVKAPSRAFTNLRFFEGASAGRMCTDTAWPAAFWSVHHLRTRGLDHGGAMTRTFSVGLCLIILLAAASPAARFLARQQVTIPNRPSK